MNISILIICILSVPACSCPHYVHAQYENILNIPMLTVSIFTKYAYELIQE